MSLSTSSQNRYEHDDEDTEMQPTHEVTEENGESQFEDGDDDVMSNMSTASSNDSNFSAIVAARDSKPCNNNNLTTSIQPSHGIAQANVNVNNQVHHLQQQTNQTNQTNVVSNMNHNNVNGGGVRLATPYSEQYLNSLDGSATAYSLIQVKISTPGHTAYLKFTASTVPRSPDELLSMTSMLHLSATEILWLLGKYRARWIKTPPQFASPLTRIFTNFRCEALTSLCRDSVDQFNALEPNDKIRTGLYDICISKGDVFELILKSIDNELIDVGILEHQIKIWGQFTECPHEMLRDYRAYMRPPPSLTDHNGQQYNFRAVFALMVNQLTEIKLNIQVHLYLASTSNACHRLVRPPSSHYYTHQQHEQQQQQEQQNNGVSSSQGGQNIPNSQRSTASSFSHQLPDTSALMATGGLRSLTECFGVSFDAEMVSADKYTIFHLITFQVSNHMTTNMIPGTYNDHGDGDDFDSSAMIPNMANTLKRQLTRAAIASGIMGTGGDDSDDDNGHNPQYTLNASGQAIPLSASKRKKKGGANPVVIAKMIKDYEINSIYQHILFSLLIQDLKLSYNGSIEHDFATNGGGGIDPSKWIVCQPQMTRRSKKTNFYLEMPNPVMPIGSDGQQCFYTLSDYIAGCFTSTNTPARNNLTSSWVFDHLAGVTERFKKTGTSETIFRPAKPCRQMYACGDGFFDLRTPNFQFYGGMTTSHIYPSGVPDAFGHIELDIYPSFKLVHESFLTPLVNATQTFINDPSNHLCMRMQSRQVATTFKATPTYVLPSNYQLKEIERHAPLDISQELQRLTINGAEQVQYRTSAIKKMCSFMTSHGYHHQYLKKVVLPLLKSWVLNDLTEFDKWIFHQLQLDPDTEYETFINEDDGGPMYANVRVKQKFHDIEYDADEAWIMYLVLVTILGKHFYDRLDPEHDPLRCILMLGSSGTGKTKFLEKFSSIFPVASISVPTLGQDEKTFGFTKLKGAQVYVSTEDGKDSLFSEPKSFLMFVTDANFSIVGKFKTQSNLRPKIYCSAIFAGNKLPEFASKSTSLGAGSVKKRKIGNTSNGRGRGGGGGTGSTSTGTAQPRDHIAESAVTRRLIIFDCSCIPTDSDKSTTILAKFDEERTKWFTRCVFLNSMFSCLLNDDTINQLAYHRIMSSIHYGTGSLFFGTVIQQFFEVGPLFAITKADFSHAISTINSHKYYGVDQPINEVELRTFLLANFGVVDLVNKSNVYIEYASFAVIRSHTVTTPAASSNTSEASAASVTAITNPFKKTSASSSSSSSGPTAMDTSNSSHSHASTAITYSPTYSSFNKPLNSVHNSSTTASFTGYTGLRLSYAFLEIFVLPTKPSFTLTRERYASDFNKVKK